MSVGKDSILRAANADAKKTEVKVETKPAEEVKAAAKAEAAPAAKKAPTKKTAAKKTTAARKTTRKAPAQQERCMICCITGNDMEGKCIV